METPLIKSFLDQDFYKFTMAQVVWKKFPHVRVAYAYKCRNEVSLGNISRKIEKEINRLASLKLTPEESAYLGQIRYLDPAFVSHLRRFSLDPSHVKVTHSPFSIEIRGPWLETIFWETFLLSVISELFYQETMSQKEREKSWLLGDEKLSQKLALMNDFSRSDSAEFRLIEFGTRRRFSSEWQTHVLGRVKTESPLSLLGTSNLNLARITNLRPIGTMAHEYLQAFQSLARLRDSQRAALQAWSEVYRGDLGIALTDVIGMDAFLRDFDLYFSKLFDGMRHDSGCPREWAKKALNHYEKMGIDPKTKALVFSDSLTIPLALELCREFEPRIKTSFGIGTSLTCDLPGVIPLNHVIKMIECEGQPVAKLSDSPGKSMCRDLEYLKTLERAFSHGG